MDKIIRTTNPVQGVALGQAPTLDLQVGPRYHGLFVEVIATAAANKQLKLSDVLGLINLRINGKVQRAHLATELDAIQSAYGPQFAVNRYKMDGAGNLVWPLQDVDGNAQQTMFRLAINLAEPWRKGYSATELYAWYTSWQNGSVLASFQLELFVPNTGNVDATKAFTINCQSVTDIAAGPLDANKNPVLLITKWRRQTLPYTGAGDQVFTNLWKQDIYNQLSLFSAYKNDGTDFDPINNVKIEVDNRIIRDVSAITNTQALIDREFNEAALPRDRFDNVFDLSDLPTDGLVLGANGKTVQDFRVTATINAKSQLGANAPVAENKNLVAIAQIYGGLD